MGNLTFIDLTYLFALLNRFKLLRRELLDNELICEHVGRHRLKFTFAVCINDLVDILRISSHDSIALCLSDCARHKISIRFDDFCIGTGNFRVRRSETCGLDIPFLDVIQLVTLHECFKLLRRKVLYQRTNTLLDATEFFKLLRRHFGEGIRNNLFTIFDGLFVWGNVYSVLSRCDCPCCEFCVFGLDFTLRAFNDTLRVLEVHLATRLVTLFL